MTKTTSLIGLMLVALSGATFAQDRLPDPGNDAARQERMDDAYRAHRENATARDDLHEAGHSFHNGVRATGHAIHSGVRATGHGIHNGVRATGHAIHHGVDKVTGKE